MLERVVIVFGLAAVVIVVALGVRFFTRRRTGALQGQPLPPALFGRFQDHAPGIVYFFGPHCGSCRQQASILDRLVADEGVAVVRIDASREADLANQLAVATVPATVVVDERRRVRAVNLGLQSRAALLRQLHELNYSSRAPRCMQSA